MRQEYIDEMKKIESVLSEVTFSGGGSDDAAKAFKILGTRPKSSVTSIGIVAYGTGLSEIDAVLLKKLLKIKTFTGVSFNPQSKLEIMFDLGDDFEDEDEE